MSRIRIPLSVLLVAVGLTVLFWRPLWTGGGLIGGDIYSYFFPQKAYYADRLAAGEFPLWNNRAGHGYPLVGESQTAPFYPFHLLFYGTLPVNDAYNANHLLHYVLAFLFTWMYVRRIGLAVPGSLLASLVYTYGWFPPRSCLEWAIIGGAWLPLALWCVESFLQSRRRRYLLTLSTVLAVQLLAGHYNLAFITHLVLFAYVPLRLWLKDRRAEAGGQRSEVGESKAHRRRPVGVCGLLLAALLLGYALAAVQLLPTWQLKQNSQRAAGVDFDPAQAHIPPAFWSQIVLTPPGAARLFADSVAGPVDIDRALGRMSFLAMDSATNKAEAHLYFGLIPAALILWGLVRGRFGPREWMWLLLGGAALVYTAGWFVPVTRHLPGFGYFQGPGRFGIVTTLAAAVLAGSVLDGLVSGRGRNRQWFLVGTILLLTIADLFWISRAVTYTQMLQDPPIDFVAESSVRRILSRSSEPVRLYAPGNNLPTILGVASTPPYLPFGPAEYADLDLPMPAEATAAQIERLQRAGVTHVLSFKPLDRDLWPATLVWQGFDAFLNPAWARYREPIYLYRLEGSRGRAALVERSALADAGRGSRVEDRALQRPQEMSRRSSILHPRSSILEYAANRVVLEVHARTAGQLVLTDLQYPGWRVTVDGRPAESRRFEGLFRSVEVPAGEHAVVWSYRPRCLYWGGIVSAVSMALGPLFLAVRREGRGASPAAQGGTRG